MAVVRHPDLFGGNEQAQIIARLEVVAQRPVAAHGVEVGRSVAQRTRVAARLCRLLRLHQFEGDAEVGVAGNVKLVDPCLPLLRQAVGGLRRQHQVGAGGAQLVRPLLRRLRGRSHRRTIVVAPLAYGRVDHRCHKVFGEFVRRLRVIGLVEIVGTADGRHGLHHGREAAADAVVQHGRLPEGIEAGDAVAAQRGHVMLADEHLQRKLGGIAPVEDVVAKTQAQHALGRDDGGGLGLVARLAQEFQRIDGRQQQAGHLPILERDAPVGAPLGIGRVEDAAPRQGNAIMAWQPDGGIRRLHGLHGQAWQFFGNQRAQLVDGQLAGMGRCLVLALAARGGGGAVTGRHRFGARCTLKFEGFRPEKEISIKKWLIFAEPGRMQGQRHNEYCTAPGHARTNIRVAFCRSLSALRHDHDGRAGYDNQGGEHEPGQGAGRVHGTVVRHDAQR